MVFDNVYKSTSVKEKAQTYQVISITNTRIYTC